MTVNFGYAGCWICPTNDLGKPQIALNASYLNVFLLLQLPLQQCKKFLRKEIAQKCLTKTTFLLGTYKTVNAFLVCQFFV